MKRDGHRPTAVWQRYSVAKYNADQPRVPAGSSDGGEWTSGDSGDPAAPVVVIHAKSPSQPVDDDSVIDNAPDFDPSEGSLVDATYKPSSNNDAATLQDFIADTARYAPEAMRDFLAGREKSDIHASTSRGYAEQSTSSSALGRYQFLMTRW